MKKLDLTQQELALKIGTSRITLARWESGKREPPRLRRRQ
ncbi:MAG: helix-turn-helix domain-containing protein [Synergistaceae bacterium]|nr:helix-turn-helix domain-containing protein [Synergistaceae bacterium]